MPRQRCQKLLAISLFVTTTVITGDHVGVAQSASRATVNVIRNASLWQDVWPADFNGDGITDLAGSEKPTWMGGSGRALVVIGNGSAGFSAPIVTSFVGHVLAAADFNGDGRIDLVVVGENRAVVSILPGNGNGTFGSARSVAELSDVTFAVIADLDDDGKRDLVVGAEPSSARVYPGNGDLTFGTPVSLTTGEFPHDAIIADLNGDGKRDLVVANHYRFHISVFLNQGALLFTAADIAVGGLANDVTAGDLNGDGTIDLVVATANGGQLDFFSDEGHAEVLLGHGDGTFDTPVRYQVARGAWQVVVGDFTRDGLTDVATASRSSMYRDDCAYALKTWDSVSVLPGAGNGTFGAAQSFSLGSQSSDPGNLKFRNTVRTLNTSDLNRDGATDLIASWGVLLLNVPTDPNWPPTVSAGPDQTLRNTHEGVLVAKASDVDQDLLEWHWTDETGQPFEQVPNTCFSAVSLGTHVFTITVTDGHGHQASDSVTMTVTDDSRGGGTIPITAPAADAVVQQGQPYTIRWTWRPEVNAEHLRLNYTIDGGTTWTEIVECRNTPVPAGQCVWQNPGPETEQAFILVTTVDGSVPASGVSGRFSIRPAAGTLPAHWQHADIGAVAAAGGASYADGVFTVNGSGADIWGTADEFHYVYRLFTADVDLVTRVESLQNVNVWTKAGLMLRGRLDAGSAHASIFITPGKGVSFQRRPADNGTSISTTAPLVTAPVWLRLASRGGSRVLAYYKKNASDSWIKLGEQTFAGTVANTGLAVTSHVDGTTASASFSNVSVTQFPSWTTTLPGSTVGSGTISGDTFTLTNRGADIWGTSDQFTFMHAPWDGNGSISARVQSVDNTHAWAKAGVMFRGGLTADSVHVSVFVTPGRGIAMQYRSTAGGTSRSVAQAAGVAPVWLRLRRSANTFTGEWSADSTTWTTLGSITVTMGGEVGAGLALTSHNTAATGTAVFRSPQLAR